MSQVWAVLKFLAELWEAIKIALGMIKKAEHERTVGAVDDAEKVVEDPKSTEKERLDAISELEKITNRRT